MEATIEKTIISHLVFSEEYARQVVPFLRAEYFHERPVQATYELIDGYFNKYNGPPTKEAVLIELKGLNGLSEAEYHSAKVFVESLSTEGTDVKWLVAQTEAFCKDKAIYNAVNESIVILGGAGKLSKDAIPDILSEALAVAFDKKVGHDYIEDFSQRFEFYHRIDARLPWGVATLNEITKGGPPKKTLTVFIAPTGVGKSLIMCSEAAHQLTQGKNVLYITGELAEERIAERIDANLLDVTLDDLFKLSEEQYNSKMQRLLERQVGRLIVKEYPTASAHCGHFRSLLNELRLKKNFVPDVLYVDYINIFASSRYKASSNVSSYTMIKSIAEELRGLAVENDIPVITATQTNRGGMNNSDIELTDTSESVGLPFTVDLMIAVMANEELDRLGQLLFKQLKNRFGDLNFKKRFVVGVDKAKMRLHDLGDKATEGVVKVMETEEDGKPVFDRTGIGQSSKQLKDKLKQLLG